MTEKNWFYESNGSYEGPITTEALKSLITAGAITPETLVWSKGAPDWKPAEDYFQFPMELPPPLPKRQPTDLQTEHKQDNSNPEPEEALKGIEESPGYPSSVYDQHAYQRGYVARVSGRAYRENPYIEKSKHLMRSWDAGWTDKDRVLKQVATGQEKSSSASAEQREIQNEAASTKSDSPSGARLVAHLTALTFILFLLTVANNTIWETMETHLTGSVAVLHAGFIWLIAYVIAQLKGNLIKRIWQVGAIWIIFLTLSIVAYF